MVHCELGFQRIHEIPKTWIVTSAFSNGGWFNIICRHFVQSHTVGKKVGLKDLYGRDIYDNHIVKFEYYTHKMYLIEGRFTFNEDELRYEIDVIRDSTRESEVGFTCLSYDMSKMLNFVIIGDYEEKF